MFSGIASWWSSSKVTPAVMSEKYDPTNPKMNPLNPKGLKPCCACLETKSARDSCFLQHGADDGQCAELLKKHVECMRGLGFEL
ncbi:hypothetical protein OG21DRAFT_1449075 [Imleria badia]|nr:hypothetical protein OG21DRAFT_1449075 [Imleria badia]